MENTEAQKEEICAVLVSHPKEEQLLAADGSPYSGKGIPVSVRLPPITWQRGSEVPKEVDQSGHLLVAKMFLIDGQLEVFAMPKEKTPMHQHRIGARFTIPADKVRMVTRMASFESWVQAMQDCEAIADGEEEEDEDDGDAGGGNPASAFLPAPPPIPSGTP